jgi:hypothetical protein
MIKNYMNIFYGVLTIVGGAVGFFVAFKDIMIGIYIFISCLIIPLIIIFLQSFIGIGHREINQTNQQNNFVNQSTNINNQKKYFNIFIGILIGILYFLFTLISPGFLVLLYVFMIIATINLFKKVGFLKGLKTFAFILLVFFITFISILAICDILGITQLINSRLEEVYW